MDYNIAAVHAKNLWIDRGEDRMWIFCCSSFAIAVFETRVSNSRREKKGTCGFYSLPLNDTKVNYVNGFAICRVVISPSSADAQPGCTKWHFKVLSSTSVTTGFPPFAAIRGCVAQIALEMEETGQFHLVDLVRHVLSG